MIKKSTYVFLKPESLGLICCTQSGNPFVFTAQSQEEVCFTSLTLSLALTEKPAAWGEVQLGLFLLPAFWALLLVGPALHTDKRREALSCSSSGHLLLRRTTS